jgi:hypothetical protein
MEDVSQIFDRVSRELRDYARAQINTLSVTYLRDIIRSAVEHFGRAELEEFTEEALDDAVSKVDDMSLTPDDKRMLRRRLYELRTKAGPLTERRGSSFSPADIATVSSKRITTYGLSENFNTIE